MERLRVATLPLADPSLSHIKSSTWEHFEKTDNIVFALLRVSFSRVYKHVGIGK